MLQREEYRMPRVGGEAVRTEQEEQDGRTAGNVRRKLIEGTFRRRIA